MKLVLHATPDNVMRAVEALATFAREQHVPERLIFDLSLALEECGSNVVNHGLRRDATQTFEVSFERTHGAFVVTLRDRGPAFDPTAVAARKPQAAEDDAPGGWGLALVRRHLDEIGYAREGAENVLRLTKRLLADGQP